MNRLQFKIAKRYLFSKKSANAINILSWISISAMGIGVMCFILILSVVNGFEGLVFSLYDKFYSELRIEPVSGKVFQADSLFLDELSRMEGIVGYSEILEEKALLMYDDRQSVAKLKGVSEAFTKFSGISESMILDEEFSLYIDSSPVIIIGAGLSQVLRPGILDEYNPLKIYMPSRLGEASFIPTTDFKEEAILVGGRFNIQDEFDYNYAFLPLEFLRDLLEYTNESSAIEIGIKEGYLPEDIAENIRNILPAGLIIKTRQEQNSFLYKVLSSEKWVVFFILSMILLIIAFNIIGTLSMLVIEKKHDIGVLISLGFEKPDIRKIFLIEGFLQGGISFIFGSLIAISLIYLQQTYNLVPLYGGAGFVVGFYPVEFRMTDLISVGIVMVVILGLASWFPSSRAIKEISIPSN